MRIARLVPVHFDLGARVRAASDVAGLEAELLGPLHVGHDKTVSHYG